MRKLNIILDDAAREEYKEAIGELWLYSPDIMSRKIDRANIQQAFVYQTIKDLLPAGSKLLNAGAFEDSSGYSLAKIGYDVVDIDPILNTTLEEYIKDSNIIFDAAFATSVIEHVSDDISFVKDLGKNVKAGGYLVLTCDFQREHIEGNTHCPTTSLRFYNLDRMNLLKGTLESMGFAIVGDMDYSGDQDFEWEGHKYAFATMVAQKI